MAPPLYKIYVDDFGELHFVAPGKNSWDGTAYFLGYITLNLRDANGVDISVAEHQARLRMSLRSLRPAEGT